MQFNIFGLRVFINLSYRGWILLLSLNVLVIVIFFYMAHLRQKRIIKFGNFETLRRVEGYKRFSLNPSLLILKLLIISLLFLVANQSILLNIVKPISNTDFVLLIDNSPSMLTPDYVPNRLTIAKQLAIKWINEIPYNAKIGVVSFSNNVSSILKPTTNYRIVKSKIESINSSLSGGGTSIIDGLLVASSILKKTNKQKAIILITDGGGNEGGNLSNVLNQLKKENISVYSIGLGNNNRTIHFYDALKKTLSKSKLIKQYYHNKKINLTINSTFKIPVINFTKIEEISNSTGGKAFLINNQITFENAFKKILVKNEKIRLDSDYYVLITIAVLLLFDLIMYAHFGAI